MQLLTLLILFGYFFACPVAKQNEITINLKGSELIFSVPDDPEVKSVFYSTETGNDCKSDYRFAHKDPKNDSLKVKLDLMENQKHNVIQVFSVLEIKDQVITKSCDLNIDSQGNETKQSKPMLSETKPIVCDGERRGKNYVKNSTCLPAESDDYSNMGCSGRLVFEENFNDKKLTQWTHAVYSRVHTEHAEFAAYLKDEKNSYVKDNSLHIDATLSTYEFNDEFKLPDCTYANKTDHIKRCGPYKCTYNQWLPPMHSAMLQTKGKFTFKYGRIEISAKMPVGDWLFPYLLLQPNNTEVESDFTSHIRIAYVRGNPKLLDCAHNEIGGKVLFGSVFSKMNADRVLLESMMNMPLKSGSHYGDEFHNFTVIKHRDRIIYKVDGITYGTITDEMIIQDINRSECYIVLGMTAGGKFNFKDEYVNPEYTDNIKISSPQASLKFYESKSKIEATWKHPKLVIDHVHVYTTHSDEN